MGEPTPREVYERVVTHLVEQKVASIDGQGCLYRCLTLDGAVLKCAIGCIIADEFYASELEGNGVRSVEVEEAIAKSLGLSSLSPDLVDTLEALQRVHDDFSPEEIITRASVDRRLTQVHRMVATLIGIGEGKE